MMGHVHYFFPEHFLAPHDTVNKFPRHGRRPPLTLCTYTKLFWSPATPSTALGDTIDTYRRHARPQLKSHIRTYMNLFLGYPRHRQRPMATPSARFGDMDDRN